jgi:hypothetical protein
MKTPADYRKLAEDCVRLAQTAKETHRAMLLNMANTWLQFADQVARDHQWMADGPDARSDNHPRPARGPQRLPLGATVSAPAV